MKRKLFLPLFVLFAMASCQEDLTSATGSEDDSQLLGEVNDAAFIQGYLRMKVDEDLAAILEDNTDSDGMVTRTAVTRTDDILESIGATHLTRTFPPAGRFEARTRASGLHLWYEVYFDESQTTLTRANTELVQIDGVVEVEYRPRVISLSNGTFTPVDISIASESTRSSDLPFNDPRLDEQWHYNNTASSSNQIEGSDINVFAAWNSGVVGSNNVIVCVVDGGIDNSHQDLAANIWVNEAELNGSNGVDDDGNGYVDDKYGFNFVSNGGTIVAHDHGTHVAGTISAVNNNGIGVSGVAGGNYAEGIQGVLLMSSQIFTDTSSASSVIKAIKYGADNGAVISQNSWGYDYTGSNSTPSVSSSDAAAIDYFIQYAGYDEYGNQEGPMAGGVVIFAAGNEEVTYSIPGQYEPVICVTSIRADYDSAYYTNYGDWADISAPGGDFYQGSKSNQILSTTSSNSYAYYQGTSMACPHVSGVAALIVSKFGGTGFTADDLKEKIYSTARDLTDYNSFYRSGWMGAGLIDAYACTYPTSTVIPDDITSFEVTGFSNTISCSVVVPADADGDNGAAYGITAYYSTSPFDTTINRSSLPSGISSASFLVGSLTPGETLDFSVTGIEFDTQYYIAFGAYDYSRNISANITTVTPVSTTANNAPTIECLDGTSFDVKAFEKIKPTFKCYDNDGHTVTLTSTDVTGAFVLSQIVTDDVYTVTITGTDAEEGTHVATLTLTDQHGLATTQDITFTIVPNNEPEIVAQPENIVMETIGQTLTLDLSEVFYDADVADGESLSYTSVSSATSVAHIVANSDILYVTSMSYGNADITLSATDARGASVTTSFQILVRDPSVEVDLYPNPVVDILNVRMGAEYTTQISIYNTSGGNVLNQTVDVAPFTPGQVDLTSLSAGSYTLKLTYEGNELTRNIVKL